MGTQTKKVKGGKGTHTPSDSNYTNDVTAETSEGTMKHTLS